MRGHSEFTADNAPGNNELVHLDVRLAGLGARLDEVDGEIARLGKRVTLLNRERTALVEERGVLNKRRTILAIALSRRSTGTPHWQPVPAPRPAPQAIPPQPVPPRPVPHIAAPRITAPPVVRPPQSPPHTAAPPRAAAPQAAQPQAAPPQAAAPQAAQPQAAQPQAAQPQAAQPQAAPPQPAPPQPAPPPADEASALSVQAVLLTLGGLLLGVAAITFTAVAWTTFGPAGRAAILGTVTLIALAVPWLLNRRGLAATAETISAVALLLVGLDGYAAHSVGLFGVDRLLPAPTFAGLVLLGTAAVAAGYRRLAPLHTPGYVALLAMQPVLPLLIAGVGAGSGGGSGHHPAPALPVPGSAAGTVAYAGIGMLAATVAAQDVVTLRWLRRSPGTAVDAGRRVLAWLFVAVTGAVAWVAALLALVPAPSAGVALPASLALVAAATVGVAVAALTRPAGRMAELAGHTAGPAGNAAGPAGTIARGLAAGAAAVAIVLAVGVPAALAVPGVGALPFAMLVAGLAHGVRRVPGGWRRGAEVGTAAVGGVLFVWALVQIPLGGDGPALPATLLCLTVAATALPKRAARHHATVAGLVATVLALPSMPLVTVAAALAFGVSTLLAADRREEAVRGGAGLVLAVAAVGAGLADVRTTAAVLGALVVGGVAIAVAASRWRPAPDVAGAAVGVAVAAGPGAVVALMISVGVPGHGVRAAALVSAAAAVLVAAGLGAAKAARAANATKAINAGALVGSLSVLLAGDHAGALDVLAGALPAVAAVAGLIALADRRHYAHQVLVAGAVAAGIAVGADLAAGTLPGTGLVAAAGLVAGVAWAGRRLRKEVRAGVWVGAGIAGAVVAAVAVPLAGGSAWAAALTAVRPPWTSDLGAWHGLADDVAVLGWQVPVALALVAVGLMARDRRLPALLGIAAVAFAAPAAFGLPWWSPMLVSGVAGAGLALVAVRKDSEVTAGVAALLGLHAAVASLGRPWTTAAVLGGTVVVCVLVAVRSRLDKLRDAAVGGALAAVPGAAAATAAALSARPALVLSLGLATASLALGVASLIGLARRAELPALGAVAGALVCVAVSAVVPTATGWDHLAAGLLLVGALSRVWRRRRESRGAGGATLAFVAEMSQLVALLVPGVPVLTTAAVVLATALVVRRLPAGWRSGPLGGLAIAAAAVALVAGLATVVDAAGTVATLSPWGADLGRWLRPEPPGVALLHWQPAAALVVLAVAALLVRRASQSEGTHTARAAPAFVLLVLGLAAVHAPIGAGLPWWTPAPVATLAAAGFALAAVRITDPGTARFTAGLAAVLAGYAVASSLARPTSTAIVLTALVAMGAAIAAFAARTAGPAAQPASADTAGTARPTAGETGADAPARPAAEGTGAHTAATARPAAGVTGAATPARPAAGVVGGGALFVAVALAPGAAAAWVRAFGLAVAVPHVTVVAAGLVLGGAILGRYRYPRWARSGVAVATASVLAMPPADPGAPTLLHAAAAALIGMVAAVLIRTSRAAKPGVVPWVVPAAVVGLSAVPPLVDALVEPGRPEGIGPVDGILPALALVTAGLAGLMWFGGMRRWLAAAVLTPAAATVLIAPEALALPWPAGVLALLLVAVAGGIAAARVNVTDRAGLAVVVLCCAHAVTAGGAALAGSTASRATTFTTLGVAALAGLVAGAIGRYPAGRTVGWLVAAGHGLALATLVAADLGSPPAGPFAVAVLLLAGAAALDRLGRHRAEIVALEVGSVVAAIGALVASAGLRGTATALIGYGAVLGLSALRGGRRWFAPVAGAVELLAWWMLLFAADIGLIEAYTLPFALFAVVGGALGLRHRPALRSWVAYGPALAAAFLPSLALVLAQPGEPLRRLVVGAGAIAVVVVGGARRRQAPVVVGAVVLVLVTLHELVVWWDLLPRWIPLAAGGLVLVTVGATYERRRRDVRLIRVAVQEMR
ncbi:SCO7613 C-terminal domain-containing membrane protein [Virgisporangium aurantiacum]|uniref:Uncharacterized protein n=1 Tax=Virgisporangium aurantiacum TaxID=175570 RepID=A0A8J4E4D7_9ACTN|nr:hypothetical protein [Virgisporangium aurantiacum]GIJ60969.1 hypothetical protein Vau01_084850 [Virgisporangium aurantiacum]